jgi:phytoene synthase
VDDRLRALMRYQVARVRRLEQSAIPGIALLDPTSRPCIDAARILYCGIVDEIERNDYDVFSKRATVPWSRRLAVAGPAWVKAVRAR